MQIVIKGGVVIATHDDAQAIAPDLYGPGATVSSVAAWDGEPGDPAPTITADMLRAYAARRRWEIETGGCAWQGHVIATDRDSQTKLIAEMVAISAGLRQDGSAWKFKGGDFGVLTNAEALQMIGAARAHIAAAFAFEAAALARIESGAIMTLADVDAVLTS